MNGPIRPVEVYLPFLVYGLTNVTTWVYIYGMHKKTKRKYPLSELGAKVAVREAKAQFSALVERAAAGEEIVITWHGRPRARLLPLAEERGTLRVDREWLDTMRVSGSETPAANMVRADRDNRG